MCSVSLFVWVTHLPLVQSGSTELCTQELLNAYRGVLGTGAEAVMAPQLPGVE